MFKLSHLFGPHTKAVTLSPTEATILFSDITNFTRISSTRTPEEIVNSLEDLFSRFDRRAAREDIQKVKTIGDSYMAFSSAPLPPAEQIYRIIKFATGMYDDLAAYNETAPIKYRLRIGVNIGEVIAGISNQDHTIYDLWGDSVNVANRMETIGKENLITVTKAVHTAADDRILFDPPIRRHVKGKGLMTIYTARLRPSTPDTAPNSP